MANISKFESVFQNLGILKTIKFSYCLHDESVNKLDKFFNIVPPNCTIAL